MKDEDYAFETQRQRRLDNFSARLEALLALRATLEKFSHHDDSAYRYGFLCSALSDTLLPRDQADFIRYRIILLLDGASVLPMHLAFSGRYMEDPPMFEAIHHAYRLGIVDQWITNHKEKME
jgi:hypothetical protein